MWQSLAPCSRLCVTVERPEVGGRGMCIAPALLATEVALRIAEAALATAFCEPVSQPDRPKTNIPFSRSQENRQMNCRRSLLERSIPRPCTNR